MSINVNRKPILFVPDPKRVIARFFMPGGPERAKKVISRILQLPEYDALQALNQTLRDFSDRHRNISRTFTRHFNRILPLLKELNVEPEQITNARKLLIGSYFTMEYAIEAAAFFNPSMVEHPDQSNLQQGQKRIIVSFRATGEGHISSIVFREGIIDKHNHLEFKAPGKLVDEAETIQRHVYHKDTFIAKLNEMQVNKPEVIDAVMNKLNDTFIYGELQAALAEAKKNFEVTFSKDRAFQSINWLASSHYEISFSLDTAISERVIFPISYTESNGIEDARFVKFTHDDGQTRYYATYTAYNGYTTLPKLIVTKDFYNFKVMPINGQYAQNKGMALFPRKINGKYVMLSRYDGENNYVMFSDDINFWEEEAILIQQPRFPWEFVQLGNSGSPIETERGWLVITHGVGAMRRYCLGAILLDLDDPTQVIGYLPEPLLMPNDAEREGYVPNVVYSCGAIVHNNELIIPYAMADYSSGFASVDVNELFEKMLPAKMKETPKAATIKPGYRILFVRDERNDQTNLAQLLIQEGYYVEVASDG
ncbi:MAG: glycoside hydrolase family 130 protein, partial [Bacteroidota bacterium]|nr:glycoside hydrolase family 130 protein [Bacteroidota bacterium]